MKIVKPERDSFDRFPAEASLAYQEGFLDRPIVNEYVKILWWAMKSLWKGLERSKSIFRLYPTHDFDHLKPSNIMSSEDPYNTFNWIMNVSEKFGLQSTFYFFGEKTNCNKDGQYDIHDKLIIDLIKQVSTRGHEIGYHGSYYSYLDQKRLQREFDRLKRVCKTHVKEPKNWGARQHYLRYNVTKTARLLERIGITYDSSLTFAAYAGFRCGCCYEYPLFDFSIDAH